MNKYEFRALVGTNGCGTIIEETINGTEEQAMERIREINKEYGGFYNWSLIENGIMIFNSNWR